MTLSDATARLPNASIDAFGGVNPLPSNETSVGCERPAEGKSLRNKIENTGVIKIVPKGIVERLCKPRHSSGLDLLVGNPRPLGRTFDPETGCSARTSLLRECRR